MRLLRALLALSLLAPSAIWAQSPAAPLPIPRYQFFDNSGRPLVGGKVFTYAAGTSTPLATYTSSSGSVANSNPLILDAGGFGSLWTAGGSYKIVVQDSFGVLQWTADNVSSVAGLRGAAGGLASLDSNGFVLQGQLNYTQGGTGAVNRSIQSKLQETVSAKDFGAAGDNSTDDTAAVQACITWSAANRATCFLPPAVYKITGAGLTMLSGQPSLTSYQSEGNGSATLMYYGTGTALSIGSTGTRIFAINLTNIGITAAAGVNAQYGINCVNVSGGDWQGVTIGGAITNGTFATAIRFSDAGHINIRRSTLSNAPYAATVGFLFDDQVVYGNDNITMDEMDTSNMRVMFAMRQCGHCAFSKVYVENTDYMVQTDNTTFSTQLQNISFIQSQYNTSGTGPTNHKILDVTAIAGKLVNVDQMHFADCRFFLSGGIVSPFNLSIGAAAAFSTVNLYVENNRFLGANTSLVASNSALARVFFGWNFVRDNTGAIRTPNISGTASVVDYAPVNTSDQRLIWQDPSGATYVGGSSGNTMTRPAALAVVPGTIQGIDTAVPANSDGFLRVGAGGTASQITYCDFSGFSTVSDMNRNIVCFVGALEVLRIDATQFKVSNVPINATGSIAAGAQVTAGTGFVSGSSAGLSVVKNMTGSGGGACTMTFSGGILTASTCP